MRLHQTASTYRDARYDELKAVEGERPFAYADGKGVASTGIGVNLRVHGDFVMRKYLGFDVDQTTLSGEARIAENRYIAKMRTAMAQTYTPGSLSDNSAQAALNIILADRANDNTSYAAFPTFNRRADFNLGSAASSKALLNDLADTGYPGFVSYEQTVNNFLAKWGATLGPSKERLALISLAYNAPGLLGDGLGAALQTDNRAEAWYQIRYLSNLGGTDGTVARRRFYEAQLFSLYEDGVAVDDTQSKKIYQMFTAHRRAGASTGTGILGYEQTFSTRIAEANQSYGLSAGSADEVKTLANSLQPAADILMATYARPYGFRDSVKSTNVQVGTALGDTALLGENGDADLILGEGGNDSIDGQGGNDILLGGSGGDTLTGGSGNDILVGDGPADAASVDVLLGGANTDRYFAGIGDVIVDDAKGEGAVFLADLKNLTVRGGTKVSAADNETFVTWIGGQLGYRKTPVTGSFDLQVYNKLADGSWAMWVTVRDYFKFAPLLTAGEEYSYLGITLRNSQRPPYAGLLPSGFVPVVDGPPESFVYCPLVLDLNGDGIAATVGLNTGVHFDHDGNARAELTGWADVADGLLVYDRNGDGVIGTGAELFGNQTLLANGTKAANGFAALAALDQNLDGTITAADPLYSELRVWRDNNLDGQSQSWELSSLAELKITSIGTGWTAINSTDENGNQHLQRGGFSMDGQARTVDDVTFAVDLARTINTDTTPLPEDVLALPNAKAFGSVLELRRAMASDAMLKSLVQTFVATTDGAARDAQLDSILLQWTGSRRRHRCTEWWSGR